MIDWQTIAVALIILAALVYTGRRAWSHLRAFRAKRAGEPSCATGCGSCGSEQKPKPATPRTVFVEISRSRTK
ncbi:MAG TPA: FeoB-associated Cys-rich membrane protein [Pyrinomonadaceae bacterium]|jgi:predicted lipid-binding transport protein (Tim44 family)|nr:FeoB-associated Cys-rich membrane protein [Pyrinomonadaceae bacterium]